MQAADIRAQWEGAAPGWARWEATVATWMEPATTAMLAMAGVDAGARVLDLACGAGSQMLRAGLPAPSRFGLVLMLDRRLANVPLIRFKVLQAEKHLM